MSRTIPDRESLTVEFKSDRKKLSDAELIETVVCMANTDGGAFYLGVEDDGSITGLHAQHRDLNALAAFIANRTSPAVPVRVTLLVEEGQEVALIEIPRLLRPVATTSGTMKRRRLQADGSPECVPFLPHELPMRLGDLGLLDHSSMPVYGAGLDELDPLERQRLRQLIERYRGQPALLELPDAELDGALHITTREGGAVYPTVAGLLLIGKEGALRRHVPAHEVAFQVMEGEAVRLNEFMRGSLVRVIERIDDLFEARISEDEIQVGLFRVAIPTVDRRAFREAVANALTHRDYSRMGALHIRWEQEAVSISNPGGFVEGVSLSNLLTTEPRPRNPALASAFQRIGLVERTGRGVDLIYRGLLRYGRPAPDYSRSTPQGVVVRLSTQAPDRPFLRLVLEQEEKTGPLPIDTLLVLSLLRSQRRVNSGDVAATLQKDDASARRVLERLVERGLVEAHGSNRGRSYTLSANLYAALDAREAYIRQAGFDAIQQEQMVKRYTETNGAIRRGDVIELCKLSPGQATRLLKRLTEEGMLEVHGQGKGTHYALRT